MHAPRNRVTSVVVLAAAALVLSVAAVHAETIICPVEADTYLLHGHAMQFGYPDAAVAKLFGWVGSDAMFRFDLSPLDGLATQNKKVVGATFRVYTGQTWGMMAQPMAPKGTTQRTQVLALRAWDPAVHPHGLTYWTEAARGDYEHGYIDGSTQGTVPGNPPNIYDPGDVGGIDPYEFASGLNTDTFSIIMAHSGGPGAPAQWDGDPANLNPDGWASVDISAITKAWVDGVIANDGIRIHDLAQPWDEGGEDWGWCFFTKDVDGASGSSAPTHPGPDFVPYLEVSVDVIPEPATLFLLGSGMLAVVGRARRRRIK